MWTLSDEELEVLLREPESTRVERKSVWSKEVGTRAREAVCAFANDLGNTEQAGVLFIGANDDGTPSGLVIDDRLLLSLTGIRSDGNILPLPTIQVEKRRLAGGEMAVVFVAPSDAPPVRYQGRIWVRSGPSRMLASAQEERILNERRRWRDLPWDLHPYASASLSDLSMARFQEEYLPRAFAPEVLAANERSPEERLAATKMIHSVLDPSPTALGLLTLCPRPDQFISGHYVQVLRFQGTERVDAIDFEEAVYGPLGLLVATMQRVFAALNQKAIDVAGAPVERVQYEYPPAAFDQLFVNAVMHRNYESNAPIRVERFTDRMTIQSNGGLFGDMTLAKLRQGQGSDYRNPNVASVMKDLGLVQRFGVGIHLAIAAMAAGGNPPLEFEADESSVRVTMRPNVRFRDFPKVR